MGILSCKKHYNAAINRREKISAGQRGTTVTVRNLFVNTPVRLAQLKKHRLSLGKVKSLVMTYALVREVRFSLQVRGNKRLDWTIQASFDAMGVVTSIYGKDFMQRYTNLSWSIDGIIIDGILPNPRGPSSKSRNTNLDMTALDKQLQAHYIYIDNRPLSLTRNPAKQFLKLLRESYSNQNLQYSFIYLNFHCDADKIKYDCNMDPSKSEVIFEKFEVVCKCFKDFLNQIYGVSLRRSPSPICVDFFGSNGLLLSPPPSSPVPPVENVYAFDENSVDKSLQQKYLGQTRLDQYRSPHTPTAPLNQAHRSCISGRPSEGDAATLRLMMGSTSEIDGIDLTNGVISGRRPRQTTNSEGNNSFEAFRARFHMSGHHQTDAIHKDSSSREARNIIKQSSTPRKTTERVVKSPPTPRTPKRRDTVRHELPPQTPASRHTPIKFRSISESPGLENSLNPWTIAALNRDPKRPRLKMNIPRQMPSYENDRFIQAIQPDMDLQTIVVMCKISMEEVAAGQIATLSFVPPICDLMDILLQYYNDFIKDIF